MKNPRITEQEIGIIKDAQAGNMFAFNKLFKRYKSFVTNVLFQYIKDMDESKDITNIVFLKVYDKLSKFTDYDSFGGWLRIIAKNTAIDYLRETRNKGTTLGEHEVRLTESSSIDYTENGVVDRMTYKQILSEFDKLPPSARKVCRLFYENNLTVEQISKTLQMSKGTIKSILSRTRSKLRNQLKV